MSEPADEDLPSLQRLHLIGTLDDAEEAWTMYTRMEATGWHFLPSQLMGEDDILMTNLFLLKATVNFAKRKK